MDVMFGVLVAAAEPEALRVFKLFKAVVIPSCTAAVSRA